MKPERTSQGAPQTDMETEPARGSPLSTLIRQWEQEGRRGFKIVRAGATSLLSLAFTEREMFQLRGQLGKVDQALSQAYRTIGEKMAHLWADNIEGTLLDEERTNMLNEVRRLLEARRDILRQIQEWER